MPDFVSYEDLVKNGHLIVNPVGISMWPVIKTGRDTVLIEKQEGRCKKYDIPLYKDKAGRYIIHRIIKVTNDGYVICGDGVCYREYGVKDENILGVVKAIYRGEKYISVESFGMKLYSRIWTGLIFARKPILAFRTGFNSLKSRMARLLKRKKA